MHIQRRVALGEVFEAGDNAKSMYPSYLTNISTPHASRICALFHHLNIALDSVGLAHYDVSIALAVHRLILIRRNRSSISNSGTSTHDESDSAELHGFVSPTSIWSTLRRLYPHFRIVVRLQDKALKPQPLPDGKNV